MNKARLWYVLAPVAAFLVLVAGWFLLVSPVRSEAADLADQAVAKESTNIALRGKVATLRQQAADLPAQVARVEALRARIPASPQLPAYIRTVSAIAAQTGTTLVSLSPQAAQAVTAADGTTGTGLAQVPLSMQVTGSYAGVKLFLARLESAQRATLVTAVTIQRGTTQSAEEPTSAASTDNVLTASVTGQIFTATAAAPAATAAPTAATATTGADATAPEPPAEAAS